MVYGVFPVLTSGSGSYIYPDIWTLLKRIGSRRICDYYTYILNPDFLDEAESHGVKLCVALCPTPNLPNPPSMWQSEAAMISYLQGLNLSQYQNHPAIESWNLTDEPLVGTDFDAGNPSQEVLNIVSIGNAGLDYIKSQDSTHPVTINLNNAGAWGDLLLQYILYPSLYQNNLAKTKNWQSLWADHCDFLARTFELCGSGSYGQPWTTYPDETLAIYTDYYDMMVEVADGKDVEFQVGCKSATDDEGVQYTEQIQDEYYKFIADFMRDRPDLQVNFFSLLDYYVSSLYDWGLFNENNNGVINVPKQVVDNIITYFGFYDDFELGGLSQWTNTTEDGGTVSVVNHDQYEGIYSCKSDIIQSGVKSARVNKAFTPVDTVYASVYVKFEELCPSPNYGTIVLVLWNGTGNIRLGQVEIYNYDGTINWRLVYRDGGQYSIETVSSPLPQTNTYYFVELKVNCSTADGQTDGSYTMWINGAQVADLTNKDTDYTSCGMLSIGRGSFPWGYETNIGTTYYDNVSISSYYVEYGSIPKTYSIDTITKKLGEDKTYDIDTTIWYLSGANYDIDVIIQPSSGGLRDYDIDTILSKTTSDMSYSIDVKLRNQFFASGWENSGGTDPTDGGVWTGSQGPPSVVTTPKHHGNYACAYVGSNYLVYKTLSPAVTELYVGAYVRATTLPSSSGQELYFFRLKNAGANVVLGLYLQHNGTNDRWGIQWRSTTNNYSGSNQQMNPSINTWYYVEVRAKCGAGTGAYQVWVNGVELTDIAKSSVNVDYTNMNRIEIGECYRSSGWTTSVITDCVVCSNSLIGVEIDTTYKPYLVDAIIKKLKAPKNYSIDILNKKLRLDETYDFDIITKKLDVLRTYITDTRIKAAGVETYDIDEIMKKSDITSIYDIDVIFSGGKVKLYGVDTIFKEMNVEKQYVTDVWIKKTVPKPYSSDVIFITQRDIISYPIDTIFKKTNVRVYESVLDAVFLKRNISLSYSTDLSVSKPDITESYTVDAELISTSDVQYIEGVIRETQYIEGEIVEETDIEGTIVEESNIEGEIVEENNIEGTIVEESEIEGTIGD